MNKPARYQRLHDQIKALLDKSPSRLSALATFCAVYFHKVDHVSWCGFYYLESSENLIVGPYQGPVACQVLAPHAGVCWAAIDSKQTQLVADVHAFPGHIACDARSRSELVVPIRDAEGNVKAVFDVDSRLLEAFDEDDARGTEMLIQLIEPFTTW